jgi:hypothetical protein
VDLDAVSGRPKTDRPFVTKQAKERGDDVVGKFERGVLLGGGARAG